MSRDENSVADGGVLERVKGAGRMTYKQDERGEYRCPDRWIDAWDAAHGFPGFTICELREYADGSSRVWRSEPIYLNDHPEHALAHGIYKLTRDHLVGAVGRGRWREGV